MILIKGTIILLILAAVGITLLGRCSVNVHIRPGYVELLEAADPDHYEDQYFTIDY